MKIRAFLPVVMLVVVLACAGCKSTEETQAGPVEKTLSGQETKWYETGSAVNDPVIYNPLEAGDVVYDDGYYRIEIESVNEAVIVLDVDGCLVEPNSDGTINLRAESVDEIEIAAGESIELVSQTMDSGINLIISYE